jgi:hypothetical protein
LHVFKRNIFYENGELVTPVTAGNVLNVGDPNNRSFSVSNIPSRKQMFNGAGGENNNQ